MTQGKRGGRPKNEGMDGREERIHKPNRDLIIEFFLFLSV